MAETMRAAVFKDVRDIHLEPFTFGIGGIDIRTTLCPRGKDRLAVP